MIMSPAANGDPVDIDHTLPLTVVLPAKAVLINTSMPVPSASLLMPAMVVVPGQ